MTDSVFVVRLVDCRGDALDSDNQAAVLTTLRSWYGGICQDASSTRTTWTLDIRWDLATGSGPAAHLLLFFVPSTRHSMIRLRAPWQDQPLAGETDTTVQGFTAIAFTPPAGRPGHRTGTLGISEIYVNRCTRSAVRDTQTELARTAFHESMHNQLLLRDGELHSHGGMAAATSTASSPGPADRSMMAAAIGRRVPQWTEGYRTWRDAYMLDGL